MHPAKFAISTISSTRLCMGLSLVVLIGSLSCSRRSDPNVSLTRDQWVSILLARSLDATGGVLPSAELNDTFFRRFGIPRDIRPAFVAGYEKLRNDLRQIREDLREERSVRDFLLNRNYSRSGDPLGDFDSIKYLSSARNPVFMAFALHAEGLPNMANIGSPEYIKILSRSFNVRENELREGILLCLKNDAGLVNEAVALMIDKNLQDSRSDDPEFLFRNVLIPYLTYISKEKPLDSRIERRIFERYKTVFNASRGKNELRDFVTAFKGFCAGEPLNVRFQNNLNAALAHHRFRVIVRDKTCVGYSILDYRIVIRRAGVNDVVFLKKISISLSLALLGSSFSAEKDVTINFDDIADFAEDISRTLDTKTAFRPLTPRTVPSWSDFRTEFGIDSANVICTGLLCREFGGLTDRRIAQRLIKKIALHEVKHKWDESRKADTGWYNVDCETSAFLADAPYGGTPLFSLLSFIYQYQDFYEGIESGEIRDKLRPLLRDAWKTAESAAHGEIDSSEVKERLKKTYTSYVPIGGGALPDLAAFEREIVEPCFRNLPEFDVAPVKPEAGGQIPPR